MAAPVPSVQLQDEAVFYKKQEVSKTTMKTLTKERNNFLKRIKALNDESRKIHPDSAEGAVEKMRENLKKHLASAKSRRWKNISVPQSLFDSGGYFTFESMYEEWHSMIGKLAKTQQEIAKELLNEWFEVLSRIPLEGDSDIENMPALINVTPENADQDAVDPPAVQDAVDPPAVQDAADTPAEQDAAEPRAIYEALNPANQNYFLIWFLFLIIFCGMQSLFFYSSEDANKCFSNPMECIERIIKNFFVKIVKCYTAYYNITIDELEEF